MEGVRGCGLSSHKCDGNITPVQQAVLVCTDLQLRARLDLSPGDQISTSVSLNSREQEDFSELESVAFCPLTLILIFKFKSDKLLPSWPQPSYDVSEKETSTKMKNTIAYMLNRTDQNPALSGSLSFKTASSGEKDGQDRTSRPLPAFP